MDERNNTSPWFDRGWLVLWGLISSAWCLTAAAQLSATFDEPHYLKYGLEAWRTGSYRGLMRGGTMPLPVDVESLPVYVWEQVRGQPFDVADDCSTILPVARAGNLVFWWLLLYFSWRLGRRLGGPWGGRLAVVLIACEPNLLAHASLATTDIAICACLAMFVEFYLAGQGASWRRRVGLPGLCYGLALAAKASALAFGPLVMLAIEMHRRWHAPRPADPPPADLGSRARRLWRETAEFRRDFWSIFFIGILFVFVYCGSNWQRERSFVMWAAGLPEGLPRAAMLFIAENLRIFPNAGHGLIYQIQHNFRGHGVYILGDWYPRAVWYYFPVALAVKLTIPVLFLLAMLLTVRPRSFVGPLGLLVVFLFLFTLNCRVQIGIRLIFPFVTFLMIALAAALARTAEVRLPARAHGLAYAAIVACLLLPMAAVWPHGLCYANKLWGGPAETYRVLGDSNFDWGQGAKELADWRSRHGHPPLKIWYFGTDPAVHRCAEHAPLHAMTLRSEEEVLREVRGSYLAVGANILHGKPNPTPSATPALAVLKTRQPVARTMTFFIYDFTEPVKAARSP